MFTGPYWKNLLMEVPTLKNHGMNFLMKNKNCLICRNNLKKTNLYNNNPFTQQHQQQHFYSTFHTTAEPTTTLWNLSSISRARTTPGCNLKPIQNNTLRKLSSSFGITGNDLQSKEEVEHFLKELTEEQRKLIYQRLHVDVLTDKYMNELASESHYLSRFGRPCSTAGLEDPTGTFTELPPKWLHSRLDANEQDVAKINEARAQIKKVAAGDLWAGNSFGYFFLLVTGDVLFILGFYSLVGLKNALPFVGFGFLDNLIMIVAGDYIDITLGVGLGISTMAAAALGNTISDVAGIASVWYVEFFAEKIGLRDPKLSALQMASTGVKWSTNIGRAVGVIVGCLLGMVPLLFLSTSEDIKEPKDKEKEKSK